MLALGARHGRDLAPGDSMAAPGPAQRRQLALVDAHRAELTGLVAVLSLFATSGLGVYHAGVELHWWQGPPSCTGRVPAGLSPEALKDWLMNARMVRCDEPAWKMWNISMAGWNAILSGTLAIVLSLTVFNHIRAKP